MRPMNGQTLTRHLCCLLAYVLLFQDVALTLAQTPALQTPRVGHTTSLLGDGTAVIAGGRSQPGGAPTESAERYDAATETVTPVPGPMTSPRAGHAGATVPNAETLLLGGEDSRGRVSSGEVLLPAQNIFIPPSLALPAPLSHFTATTLSSGKIFVVGGYNGSSLVVANAWLVDLRAQIVTPSKSRLATPRAKHAAALLVDGRVAILAGTGADGGPLNSIEVYQPADDTFVTSPVTLSVPRTEAAVALLPSGELFVTGGRGADGTVRTDSELNDLVRNGTRSGPALPGPRAGHTATHLADGRILLAGGSNGTQALTTLDRLQPLAPDTTPPSVVHVSPPDNAQDVPVDAILSVRFSEPVRVSTVTSATVVLTGPTGRVEATVGTAESGLLAFFTPASPLTPDASYTLALAGITDTSGTPLPPFASRLTTGRSSGQPPSVLAFHPPSGSEGDETTLRGERFTGATGVAFGGIAAASFTLVNDTTLKAVVPPGAVTGPLSVTTPAGTGTSAGSFVVLSKPDFKVAAAPDRGETVPGDSTVFAVHVVPSGGFLGMVKLSVSSLPGQVAAAFDKAQVGPVGYAYLTVAADARLGPGTYRFTVTGTGTINGTNVSRSVEATLLVHPGGGTSLSGQLVRLDGTPIPNYTVRIGPQATRTDAGGNFLLRQLKLEKKAKPKEKYDEDLVLVLDGRTAPPPPGLLYPVFEKLLEYEYIHEYGPNKFPHGGGRTYIPTMDPRNAARVQANSSRDQVLKFPQFPGMEMLIPAGTSFTDIDGRSPSSILVHVVETPLHLAQAHLQHLPSGVTASALYSLQFGGTVPSKPVQVTVPNRGNLAPGTKVGMWFYDVTRGGWFSPGQGTVSDDGQRIVPDPGAGITRFGCLAVPPFDDPDKVCPGCTEVAEPVVASSGIFVLRKTDLVIPGRLPLVFTRTYRSKSERQGPFGWGTGHNFEMPLATDGSTGVQLVLPTNFRVRFTQISPSPLTYLHTATPTFYGARVVNVGGVGNPPIFWHVIFKDGLKYGIGGLGLLLFIEDRHGNRITVERDASNRVSRLLSPGGQAIYFEYDSSNRITRLTGPMDQTVTYTYNAQGDLETVTDPAGGVTTYTYEISGSHHNLKTVRDARGITYLTNTYHATTSRVTQQTLATTPAGTATWQLAYTESGGVVTQTVVTDPLGKTTTYAFNSAGYTTGITNALSQPTAIDRESPSNLVTEVRDHLQRKTVFAYDPTTKNLLSITRYKDPIANPPTYTLPVTWSFTYDTANFNLLTSVTTPPSGVPPVARTWTYILDPTGKTVSTIRDPLSHDTNMFYNSFGQPTQITDALTHSTFYDYDPTWGLLTSVRDHLNNTTTYAYDVLGRRLSVTDPRGATTRFTYDLLNRVTIVADPLGGAVRFQYDPNSNLKKVIDPRGGEITYDYDDMDHLQTRTDPLTRQETFGYDLAGNLTSYTDRKSQLTTWSSYDDLNRPSAVTFQGGATLTYGYDAANRLETLTDSIAGPITWGYDPLDRLTSETTPGNNVVTYGLDDADRRTSMLVSGPGQFPVTYAWDNADRLTDITRGGLTAHYEFDNANRRTSLQLPNLVTIAYGYDEANRLTSLIYSPGATELGRLTYQYDPAGNRTVMGGSWARTLLPDAISGAIYDAANRQLSLGGKTMTYDFNGNLETLAEVGQTTTYTWDVRDRLTGLTGPGLAASFAYDSTGRRAQKTITGFTSTFQYDGADIVREVAGGSGVSYLRGRGIDEPLARIEDGGNTTCYAPDALGSTFALTDSGGGVATEYTYEPFGRTVASGAPTLNAFQFTGRENDGTGLYYYRARYYNPSAHRFIGEDPLLAPVSFLRGCSGPHGPVRAIASEIASAAYGYVANNPLGFVDPTGLEKQLPPILIMTAGVPAARSESCYECAKRIAAEMGDKYPHPRAQNFIRHCMAACEISKQCGTHCARVMGVGNELRALLPRRFGGRGEFEMDDLRNNEAGIRCSGHPSCAQCCQTVEGRGTPP